MMKRILSLFLCLLMLCAGAACAEGDPYALLQNALYRIVLRTETEDITLGSGVLFMNQYVLLTAESCCREGELFAIGEDGEHAIASSYLAGASGAAMLEMATASTGTPLSLANYDAESLPFIFGCDAKGKLGGLPMYQVLYAKYRGQNALTLSGEEGLLPGGLMADAKGNIVGLIVAQQMEGYGMYTALEPDSLYLALTGDQAASVYLPMEPTWEGGLLTLTWTDDVQREGGFYNLTISAGENMYYTTYEVQADQRSLQLAVPPGNTYYTQVQWVDDGAQPQELFWAVMTTYTLPGLPFQQYGFQQKCYLAFAPGGQVPTDVLPEPSVVTAALLADETQLPYLQVLNTYDVSEEITLPMTVSLTAPDGQIYFEEMSYIFSPEYELDDHFAVSVDALFTTCREFSLGGTLSAGEYTLRYSIGDRVAGEYTFLLEGAE